MRRPTLRRVLIAGGGLAALRAAETLRREGYDGDVLIVGDDAYPPYDRPPLSKAVLTGERPADSIVLRTPDDLAAAGIEVRSGAAVHRLDLRTMTAQVNREEVPFDGLIVATGARPRVLPSIPAVPGVHVLRTIDDAEALRAALSAARHVVVVGAGLIGSEVAASARALGLDVTIVELADVPLQRIVGAEVGAACAGLHADHGTRLLCGTAVARVECDRVLREVRLVDGRVLPADILVVGVGAVPNTEWLKGSGLKVADGVICDRRLSAGHPRVFAAGDVARWTDAAGASLRAEHWTNAAEQARVAALNLLAGTDGQDFRGSGFVWSDLYGQRLQLVGSTAGATDVSVVWGSVGERRFLALYCRDGRVVAAFAMNAAALLARSRRLIDGRAELETALAALGLEGTLRDRAPFAT